MVVAMFYCDDTWSELIRRENELPMVKFDKVWSRDGPALIQLSLRLVAVTAAKGGCSNY